MNSNNPKYPEQRSETTSSFPVQRPPHFQEGASGYPQGNQNFQGGAAGQPAGLQNPFASQQVPSQPVPGPPMYQAVPVAPPRSNTPLIIVLILVVLIFTVALAAVFFKMSQGSGDATASGSQNDSGYSQDYDSQQPAQQQGDQSPITQKDRDEREVDEDRAEGFSAPVSWNFCEGSGQPGDLNLVYAATSVTSCPFASNVRDAFVRQYLGNGNLNATVEAVSPVTGKSYTMRCRDDGTVVTCRGGSNAVVAIV